MLEAGRHPNIKLLAYSEVTSVTGKQGNFTVKVLKKARFVDEKECTACGKCIEKCPKKVPNEFELGLDKRKSIYLYFPQGIPAVVTIDKENCLFFATGKCRVCERFCEKKCIDFEQKDEVVTLNPGAIIVATGFDMFDPSHLTQYGYGKYKNVITALEYERLICAFGPKGGELLRPSDEKHAEVIGYIQCVGSRSVKDNKYCSSVCCMHATKEAMLAREHDPKAESFIFYTDFRAFGKGFQKYIRRGEQEYGIKYIRSRVAEITEDKEQNPIIWYEDTESRTVKNMKVDLVVLSTALIPKIDAPILAKILDVKIDEYGFIKTDPFDPTDTTKPGVFAAGYCQAPLDIPECVAQASAAAQRAAEVVLPKAVSRSSQKSQDCKTRSRRKTKV
ncbi:MAG: CoB--CoM heterodisulfide reductase iron-sulfur subunit A family protein [Candidatus Cloacimonadota bacterium]|nr:MAG: CoB--CoM heterodisulfide reductase iron-sulfur subunit A family protein [Candidatus Cloacimonadota bacterium]